VLQAFNRLLKDYDKKNYTEHFGGNAFLGGKL